MGSSGKGDTMIIASTFIGQKAIVWADLPSYSDPSRFNPKLDRKPQNPAWWCIPLEFPRVPSWDLSCFMSTMLLIGAIIYNFICMLIDTYIKS